MGKFSNKELEALKPTDEGRRLREDGGLLGTIRAREEGVSVKWDWRYRVAGKVRQITLGSWPKQSMPSIRGERKRLAGILSEGKDPASAKRAHKLEAKADQVEAIAHSQARIAAAEATNARMTVNQLFERWTQLALSGRKDCGAEIQRSFKKDVLPTLGGVAAEDVRRVDVARILDSVVGRGARIVARNLLGDLRQMYGFAIARGLLDMDPTNHMKRDDYGRKVERDRVLSEAEIRLLYNALPNARLTNANQCALWIQLATACRIGELLKARWEHVDLETSLWRIPAVNSKNQKEHTIQLSTFALEQFQKLREITIKRRKDDVKAAQSPWLFPARQRNSMAEASHLDEKTITKQVADRQRVETPAMTNRSKLGDALILVGGRWTPHDLRRTAATMMVELGALPEVVERCLNHLEQNRMKRIYQRYTYTAEMGAAWRLLGGRLYLLTRSDVDNIVRINTLKAKAA